MERNAVVPDGNHDDQQCFEYSSAWGFMFIEKLFDGYGAR
jgi:hypothetical protein